MTDKESVIKHLEMIQRVINRLGRDSFLIKGWSMAILTAGIIFVARSEVQSGWLGLAFLVPVVGFWILDGYFLWQERLFRQVYDEVRTQETTDFGMNLMKYTNRPKCSWPAAVFSVTLNIFYGLEIVFVLTTFFILTLNPGGQ